MTELEKSILGLYRSLLGSPESLSSVYELTVWLDWHGITAPPILKKYLDMEKSRFHQKKILEIKESQLELFSDNKAKIWGVKNINEIFGD
jgi:hypothetical protein